jgi:hypothetical protein
MLAAFLVTVCVVMLAWTTAGAALSGAHSTPSYPQAVPPTAHGFGGTADALAGTVDQRGRAVASGSGVRGLGATLGPTTALHFSSNGNFGRGSGTAAYLPGADGFNLADVSSVAQLDALPANVMGLVWVGSCLGVDHSFTSLVQQYVDRSNVFGFYLMDDPDPTGRYHPKCDPSKLKAESAWIHAHAPGSRTFVLLLNLGSELDPNYSGGYNSSNSGVDLFGVDPYPCMRQFHGCNYSTIGTRVLAAERSGVKLRQIVPVYQAFGGGVRYGSWLLPTPGQETRILSTWKTVVPHPVFDYAYSWGTQYGDQALQGSPALRAVFRARNR